ncbi:hypothetical protein Aple_036860 [Acrocarpospora pleiomorpha]|uniref:Uncharacterized protein n=1 Tax=Acrocarpospora pleiomorpha TaxID=90975 RepID=A0A5M3XIL8_9ACTN|nr:hypothetical protein Aple_036860 [Acrocarpospora pleiomorpha]
MSVATIADLRERADMRRAFTARRAAALDLLGQQRLLRVGRSGLRRAPGWALLVEVRARDVSAQDSADAAVAADAPGELFGRRR